MLAGAIRQMSREDTGFTLMELMIVILVILILAVLLIPQLGLARERANKATCVSNQRNIETAVAMYLTDNQTQIITGGKMKSTGSKHSTPNYDSLANGSPVYTVPQAFIEPDDPTTTNGSDYYLSQGSTTTPNPVTANEKAPSYGHVACAYAADVNTSGCTPGDPWVACYNGGGSGTGLSHERGASASP